MNAIGTRLAEGPLVPLLPETGASTTAGPRIEQLLARVLPQDDSSIQFSSPSGVGLSRDLEKTLAELFERYVERYASRTQADGRRNDEEVWRVFRDPLTKHQLTGRLTEKRIAAKDYEYNFARAWKNEIWHVYEPVSFDLADGNSIVEKANRWVGRAVSLSDCSEPFEMHLLLGEPQDEKLRAGAFVKAQNILNRMPVKKELVREGEAEAFAQDLALQMAAHPDDI